MPLVTALPSIPSSGGTVDGTVTIETKMTTGNLNTQIAAVSKSVTSVMSSIVSGIGKGIVTALVAVVAVVKLIVGLLIALPGILIGIVILLNRFGERLFSTFERGIDKTSAYFKLLEQLRGQFDALRGAIFSVFATLLQAALPFIVQFVGWLVRALNLVNQVLAALLGQKTVMQGIVKSTQDQQKAAEGSLAAFDKLDVLQKNNAQTAIDNNSLTFQQVPISDQAQKIADKILNTINAIKKLWNDLWSDPLGTLQKAWTKFLGWLQTNIFDPIKKWWDGFIQSIATNPLGVTILAILQNWVGTWIQIINNTVASLQLMGQGLKLFFLGIGEVITGFFTGDVDLIIKGLQDTFIGVFTFIGGFLRLTIGNWIIYFTGIVNQIKILWAGLGEDIKKALLNIGLSVALVFAAQVLNIKNMINSIITLVNFALSSITGQLNGLIGLFNLVTKTVSPSAPQIPNIPVFQIPHLANGAVIPPNAQFLAVLGDQKSGNNIEAPESLIRSIVHDELQGLGNVTITVPVNLDGEKIFQNQKRVSLRHGTSLLAGGTV